MIKPCALLRRRRWDDRGGISVFIALITPALLLLSGLLTVDAFGALRTRERADALTVEAARAAQQAIDPSQAIPGKAFVVEPQAATAAARAYLSKANVSGTITIKDDGHTIEVNVTSHYDAKFAPKTFVMHARSTATLLHGITQPED